MTDDVIDLHPRQTLIRATYDRMADTDAEQVLETLRTDLLGMHHVLVYEEEGLVEAEFVADDEAVGRRLAIAAGECQQALTMTGMQAVRHRCPLGLA